MYTTRSKKKDPKPSRTERVAGGMKGLRERRERKLMREREREDDCTEEGKVVGFIGEGVDK